MFERFRDFLDGLAENRRQKRMQAETERKTHQYRAETRARAEAARQSRIKTVRVFTGDVKYRYATIDTIREWDVHVIEPNAPYEASAATELVVRRMQERAVELDADIVIHAQFHIIRYLVQRGKYQVPCYEVHAFGTAIKVLGPPSDWGETPADAS